MIKTGIKKHIPMGVMDRYGKSIFIGDTVSFHGHKFIVEEIHELWPDGHGLIWDSKFCGWYTHQSFIGKKKNGHSSSHCIKID